jgi:hypothetical protein
MNNTDPVAQVSEIHFVFTSYLYIDFAKMTGEVEWVDMAADDGHSESD